MCESECTQFHSRVLFYYNLYDAHSIYRMKLEFIYVGVCVCAVYKTKNTQKYEKDWRNEMFCCLLLSSSFLFTVLHATECVCVRAKSQLHALQFIFEYLKSFK